MRALLLSLAFLSLAGRNLAQSDGLDSLIAGWKAYRNGVAQEKLFVHTDKSVYLAGEIIWFKIYCVGAYSHQPMSLSKVAYVDVLDKDDRFVLQGKIALDNGEGNGSFFLPLTVNSGHYKLRAYTNWMKNFGPDYFFEQLLTVINTLKELPASTLSLPPSRSTLSLPPTALPAVPPSAPAIPGAPAYSITFFPEGGDLVRDIPTRVAFRAVGSDGRGIDCQGVVLDENKDTAATFASLRSGIGQFLFTPSGDHHYQSIVRFPRDPAIPIINDLPVAQDHGYVMNVNDAGGAQLKVTVHARGALAPDLYLLGSSRNRSPLAVKASLVHDSAEVLLSRDSLGEGVTVLTLFDAALHPVAERLYFRRPAQPLSVDVKTDKPHFGTRSKVTLNISLPDSAADLSLAVVRVDSLQPMQPEDIYSYLWLSSDLKGRVESPEYYVTARGAESDRALDDLMLTHGWRRFRHQPAFSYPPEHNGHIVAGRLTDARTGGPVSNRMSFFSAPGTAFRFQTAVSDSAGGVFFDVKDFYGSGGIVLHVGSVADSPCKVEIFTPFSEQYAGDRLPPFSLSGPQRRSLAQRSENMQVRNIYSNDSLQRFRVSLTDTLPFYGIPDHTYLLDDYVRFTTMEEVLREYVREINVTRPNGRAHALMLNEPRKEFFQDDNTLVLLDGVPVPNDKIFFYDPLRIRRLDVVSQPYLMGPAIFSGIASFTTYKGDYEGLELDRHSILLDYDGMQFQREFYAPAYDTPGSAESRLPDFRDLMFWSPDIHMEPQGVKVLNFYTSDLQGTYKVMVQGITQGGRACTGNAEFTVQ